MSSSSVLNDQPWPIKSDSFCIITMPGRVAQMILEMSQRCPRLFAGCWFGAWGSASAAVLFLGPALNRGLDAVALYVVVPGIASFVAGFWAGFRILDSSCTLSTPKAAGVGLTVAVLALAIYAPLFAIAYGATQSAASVDWFGLTAAAFAFGLLATAPVTLAAGVIAGLFLFALRHAAEKT